MNWRIIQTLVSKDIDLFFKNRFFAFITVLGLVFYIAVYFLMPKTVDETLEMALYAPVIPEAFAASLEEEGVVLHIADSEAALKEEVASGEFQVGLALPDDMAEKFASGEKPQAHLYFSADLPEEFQELYVIFVQELAFMVGGQPINVEATAEVLGPDLAGQQIPPRDRMLPLLAVFILMMETLGLASLISMEIETRTLQALLVTPVRVADLFLSKGITGTTLAFSQAAFLLLVTGGLSQRPDIILLAILLGAVMVTGLGFFIASVARDMMSVMGWGVLVMLLLAIPGFTILLPGLSASGWIRILPAYYLVDTVHRVLNFSAGWQDVGANLLLLAAFSVVFLVAGALSLRRKFS